MMSFLSRKSAAVLRPMPKAASQTAGSILAAKAWVNSVMSF